jgi:hypothetical protein
MQHYSLATNVQLQQLLQQVQYVSYLSVWQSGWTCQHNQLNPVDLCTVLESPHQQKTFPSRRNGCVRADELRESHQRHPGGGLLHASASIPCVALHIALWSPFLPFFLLCQSSILNTHSGVVANCDHRLEWVHWIHACIGIAMQWVPLRKSLHTFLLH